MLDLNAQACSPELQARVNQTRERAMHEMLPASMLFGLITAMGVLAVLWDKHTHAALIAWFGARLLVSVVRLSHSYLFLSGNQYICAHSLSTYRLLSMLDGVAWGVLGWALTPVHQLDVAIVTVGVLIGVASLGTFMLHVDLPSAALFVVPILLPSALHAQTRQDALGWFCCLAVLGLMVVLLAEARRSNRRMLELLCLRFESEQVSRAQAEALKQAQLLSETKSRFVATMSHEMRTPLHGILGLVRLLKQRDNDITASHQLDLIRSAGDHLVNVINDVLDFSRMEAGSVPLHRQAFDLAGLLREVAETSNVSATEKGLTLDIQLDIEHDADVEGDPIRIRQVLHNLLGNAIKFTPAGHVRLHAWREPGSHTVNVAVHDSGIGIPPEEQTRVFEAFHQAEGTYQRRFGGTGLGLTISRELCLAMGGELRCRSEVGRGSVFTFALPLPVVHHPALTPAQAAMATQAPHQTNPAGGPGTWHEHDAVAPHVLLVEDNPVNALIAEAELHNMGVQVTVIRNGRDAVDWLDQHQADLVLMDCEMPELDGFEATRHIRERERQTGRSPISIVALTANGWEAYANRCRGVGMNDHLAKPFRPDDLARTLSRHLQVNLCAG